MNLQPIYTDLGDLFTLEQFRSENKALGILPYDGCGHFVYNGNMMDVDSDCFDEAPEGVTHVIWFNK
jgi:hypothetical protein